LLGLVSGHVGHHARLRQFTLSYESKALNS
jgi:hypothetical protein